MTEIAPGISVHLLPGHSHGQMSVQVNTKRGRVFLASDAAHFYDNIWKRNPFSILQHIPEYCDSHDKMLQMAQSPMTTSSPATTRWCWKCTRSTRTTRMSWT